MATLVDDLPLLESQRCGGVLSHINGLAEDGEWHRLQPADGPTLRSFQYQPSQEHAKGDRGLVTACGTGESRSMARM
jgi:hypothetical protein